MIVVPSAFFGILPVFKPCSWSSHDVVRYFKGKIPRGVKIGHVGTLDPFAEGVLLLTFGAATKIADYVHTFDFKKYCAIGKLGVQTDTGDYTGKIIQEDAGAYSRSVISQFDCSFLQEQLQSKFQGEYLQVPPYYSAVKYQGRKLHQWARQGVYVRKPPVKRFIQDLVIHSYSYPNIEFSVNVSSGTYIRTLFEDMAATLGTIGTLEHLTRTQVIGVSLKQCLQHEQWPKDKGEFEKVKLYSPWELLPYPRLKLSQKYLTPLLHGRKIATHHLGVNEKNHYWVEDESGKVVGLLDKHQGQSELNLCYNISYLYND